MSLGPRPKNPAEISFAPECFRQVGTRTEYSVARSAIHSGPAVFTDPGDAARFARATGRPVTSYQVAIRERVSWRKP